MKNSISQLPVKEDGINVMTIRWCDQLEKQQWLQTMYREICDNEAS